MTVHTSTSVQITHNLKANNKEGDNANVPTSANENTEGHRICGRTKNVTMNLLPAVLISQISVHIVHLFVPIVTCIILSQSAHENHRHQTDKEDDHHERIENAEPVDSMLKEVWIEVLVKSVDKLHWRLFPVDLVTKTDCLSQLELHFLLTSHVHVDNLLSVKAHVKFSVRPQVHRIVRLVQLAHTSHDGQLIDVRLVEVVVANCKLKGL